MYSARKPRRDASGEGDAGGRDGRRGGRRCTQLIGGVRGVDRQQNGQTLEDIAQAIHETLTKGHELVLEMVGESVTYTDKMQPGNGPGRRRNR
eukprot:1194297-Prorocentrum_minimum.AAC.2